MKRLRLWLVGILEDLTWWIDPRSKHTPTLTWEEYRDHYLTADLAPWQQDLARSILEDYDKPFPTMKHLEQDEP